MRSRRQPLAALEAGVVNALMEEMRGEALAVVAQAAGAAVGAGDLQESRHAYMRYVGQGHEIPVALPVGPYDDSHREVFRGCFENAYRKLYGRTIEGVEVEALSWTLTLAVAKTEAGPRSRPVQGEGPASRNEPTAEPVGRQQLRHSADGEAAEAPVFLRQQLAPGQATTGPALITEEQTTTVVPPGWQACIDEAGSIVLTRTGSADG